MSFRRRRYRPFRGRRRRVYRGSMSRVRRRLPRRRIGFRM